MWTPITGYDIPYRANEEGSVQRQTKTGLWLYILPKPRKTDGWLTFNLRRNGRSVQVGAKRLMYETFIGPIPKGQWIRAKDGRADHIAPDNLYIKKPKKYVPKKCEIEKIGSDGKVMKSYKSMVDAARDSFCERTTVRRHCNGEVKDRFGRMGFSFRYKEETP